MKRQILVILIGLCLSGFLPSLAFSNEPSVLFITRYPLSAGSDVQVYGLFDLGTKPSVRVVFPSLHGGELRFRLHGRQYRQAVMKPFSVSAGFEDVTGRIFQESPRYAFEPSAATSPPQWFASLEEIVGMYGSQDIRIQVPPGASIINLRGEDGESSRSPNQLLGYISHLQLSTNP